MTNAQTSTSTSASNPAEPKEASPTMLCNTVTNAALK